MDNNKTDSTITVDGVAEIKKAATKKAVKKVATKKVATKKVATKKVATKKVATKKVATKKVPSKKEVKKVATKKAVKKVATKKVEPSYDNNVLDDNFYFESGHPPQPLLPEEEAQVQEYLNDIRNKQVVPSTWYEKIWKFFAGPFSSS